MPTNSCRIASLRSGARARGAFAALFIGVPVGIAVFVYKLVSQGEALFGVADLYVSLGVFAISGGAMVVGTLLSPASPGAAAVRDEALYFRWGDGAEGDVPFLRRSGLWLVVLVVLIVVLYWLFR